MGFSSSEVAHVVSTATGRQGGPFSPRKVRYDGDGCGIARGWTLVPRQTLGKARKHENCSALGDHLDRHRDGRRPAIRRCQHDTPPRFQRILQSGGNRGYRWWRRSRPRLC